MVGRAWPGADGALIGGHLTGRTSLVSAPTAVDFAPLDVPDRGNVAQRYQLDNRGRPGSVVNASLAALSLP